MLEVHSRSDYPEDSNFDQNSPSKPILVVAPEISSWDIAERASFNLEQDDEEL